MKNGYHPDFYRKWAALRKELYKTGAYQLFLREVRIRAMYRCQRCNKPGRHVHHKERVYDNPDRVVDVTNGEYLCIACHRKEHNEEKQSSGAHKRPAPKARRGADATKPTRGSHKS